MISLKDIIEEYNLKSSVSEGVLDHVGTINNQTPSSILWLKNEKFYNRFHRGFLIVSDKINVEPKEGLNLLFTNDKPRKIFASILNKYFVRPVQYYFVNEVEKHRKNEKLIISENVFIGQNTTIGDGTVIFPNVIIEANSVIGKNCVIKSHVSIGTEGLGYEFDEDSDNYIKFPQLGNVILEDEIEIGPTSTVRRAALESTIIKRGTKIGSLVNIGHNCIIGKNCILTCQIVTAGSSVIGDNVFMGIGTIVKNGINIGNDVTTGQGSIITKHVSDSLVVVGNPAEPIENYLKWSALRKELLESYGI